MPAISALLMQWDRATAARQTLQCGRCEQQEFPPSRHSTQDPIKRSGGKRGILATGGDSFVNVLQLNVWSH